MESRRCSPQTRKGWGMALSTVVFDVGEVITHWVPQRAFEQVMPATEVAAFMKRIDFAAWNRANDALASIAPSGEEMVRRFPADEVGIRAYRPNFLLTVAEMVAGTGAIIAELQQAGVAVRGLTNWSADMFRLTRAKFGILGRFPDIFISGEHGIVKPDPAIYRAACERFGIDPSTAVFVDDVAANVAGAASVEMTGLQFFDAATLRRQLVELGLLGARQPVSEPVFHWVAKSDWDAALEAGSYRLSGRGLDYLGEGFVHLSFADQLQRTRSRFYGDLADTEVVLLELPTAPELPIVVEDGFPHLFAPLPLEQVKVVSG